MRLEYTWHMWGQKEAGYKACYVVVGGRTDSSGVV